MSTIACEAAAFARLQIKATDTPTQKADTHRKLAQRARGLADKARQAGDHEQSGEWSRIALQHTEQEKKQRTAATVLAKSQNQIEGEAWFNGLTKKQQDNYLKLHPKSTLRSSGDLPEKAPMKKMSPKVIRETESKIRTLLLGGTEADLTDAERQQLEKLRDKLRPIHSVHNDKVRSVVEKVKQHYPDSKIKQSIEETGRELYDIEHPKMKGFESNTPLTLETDSEGNIFGHLFKAPTAKGHSHKHFKHEHADGMFDQIKQHLDGE